MISIVFWIRARVGSTGVLWAYVGMRRQGVGQLLERTGAGNGWGGLVHGHFRL